MKYYEGGTVEPASFAQMAHFGKHSGEFFARNTRASILNTPIQGRRDAARAAVGKGATN